MNSPSIAASFLLAGILSLVLHNVVIGPVEIVSTQIVSEAIGISDHVEVAKMVKRPL